jgi:predicted transcriptional regulator
MALGIGESSDRSHEKRRKEKATLLSQRGLYFCRQRPQFTLSLPKGSHTLGACSTIGPAGLDSVLSRRSPLTPPTALSKLAPMEVHFRPETESRLQELATKTGRAPGDLIEDAMAGYLQELAQIRGMLDGRYDDLKSGRVKPLDGEEAFANLRRKSKSDARRARP